MTDLTSPSALFHVDVEAVATIVRDVASQEIMPRWRRLAEHEITQKSGPRDLVTVADRAAEAALARRLTSQYPGSRVVGEETFAASPDCLTLLQSMDPVWVIDPIDGTYAFAHGDPGFGVMVALVQAGELLAAWIHQPVDDTMTLGERGGGVEHVARDGARTAAVHVHDRLVADMTGIVSSGISLEPSRSETRFSSIRQHVCPARDYPLILRGVADFTAYNKNLPWDHLAGAMLLAEAGYVVAKFDGTPYQPGDMTGGILSAPSRRAWQEIREHLIGADRTMPSSPPSPFWRSTPRRE